MCHHKPVVIPDQVKAVAAKMMNWTFLLFTEECVVLFFFREFLSLSVKFPQVWLCSGTSWITPDLDAARHSCMFFNTALAENYCTGISFCKKLNIVIWTQQVYFCPKVLAVPLNEAKIRLKYGAVTSNILCSTYGCLKMSPSALWFLLS